MMQAANKSFVRQTPASEQRRCYRVERQFSETRRMEEFVRDLLRAHCGEYSQ